MSFFVNEIVTPASHATDRRRPTHDLAASVVEECERLILWRAVVQASDVRKVVIDGPLPSRIELEPLTAIVGLTKWTPTDPDAVIDSGQLLFREP